MADFQSIDEIRSENPVLRKEPSKKSILRKSDKTETTKNSVQVREQPVETHFAWALTLLILCFFILGPIWAFIQTFRVRRLVREERTEEAERLSQKVASILCFSTVVGIFIWVAILFCSIGLLLTGVLVRSGFV